ncbi:hypothetical protein FW320_26635 [Azospirillum sp. Vi22]|uniref:hypothetical protein n=1 Tax=Azospirillum baldaniorum TaxID=1064539 RepID=UPI00157A2D44|nr:hypothetical protein [Azospirillum baldaniorum]NUB09724.1 hypothetical protein [Azospirillum baldaniorum]
MRNNTALFMTPDQLTKAESEAPPHYRPILIGIRLARLAALFVLPGEHCPEPGAEIAGRPLLVILSDDPQGGTSHGPAAFDRATLDWIGRRAAAAVLISAGAEPSPYTVATTTALMADGAPVLLIETTAKYHRAWSAWLETAAPGAGVIHVAGGMPVMKTGRA